MSRTEMILQEADMYVSRARRGIRLIQRNRRAGRRAHVDAVSLVRWHIRTAKQLIRRFHILAARAAVHGKGALR